MQRNTTGNNLKESICYGPSKPIDFDEQTSVGEELLESLLKDPQHIAQICCHNGKQYTNLEIADLAINIARNLKKLGLKQNDIIGFCGSNTDYVAPLIIGAQLNGIVVSTLDPSFEKDGIKHIFNITKPLIMFCDGSNFQRVKIAFTAIKLSGTIYTMCDHIPGVPEITEFLSGSGSEQPFSCDPLEKGFLQTAMILCSSGTTGLPKGVCIAHAGLLNCKTTDLFQSVDRILCFSSLYWASGLISLTLGTMMGCTRLITKNPFSAKEFFEIINKYKATAIFSPPSQMAILVGTEEIHTTDLSSIRSYICGGSVVTSTLVSKMQPFLSRGEIVVGYGMTEIPGISICTGVFSESGSTGKLSSNVQLKIINDEGQNLGINELGEILVRTHLPFIGYYGNEAATAAACDVDGWIHTGDIGYVNENEEIFVIDRKKEILKYNNYHFSPSEIESVIMEIPDVIEVCVCGIPDEIATYLPAALIVCKHGSSLKENDVFQYVAGKMDFFKHLRGGIYFVPEIEKTPSGKNLRRKAVELCQSLRKQKLNSLS